MLLESFFFPLRNYITIGSFLVRFSVLRTSYSVVVLKVGSVEHSQEISELEITTSIIKVIILSFYSY